MCGTRKSSLCGKFTLLIVAVVCWLCIGQSALAGTIVGWGSQVVDSSDPGPLVAIAAGWAHSLGLKSDGSIVGWGNNGSGRATPPDDKDFIAIVGGGSHSLGLKQDGSVAAWGSNGGWYYDYVENEDIFIYHGQCDIPTPNSGFTAIAAGGYHSLGLKEDGSIETWGLNGKWIFDEDDDYGYFVYLGQCDVPSPNGGFIAIAAGGYHSLGLKQDGSIVAWGGMGTAPDGNDFAAIAAGLYHSLGLKRDGTIVAWGDNQYGQCDIPSPNGDFVAIGAGHYHSIGLKSDGSIVAWGWNYSGECDIPEPNSDFMAIAAGGGHNLGLKADGSIIAWGSNFSGQAIPLHGNDFVAITAGIGHSLALKSDGSIIGWGYDNYVRATPPDGNDFVAVAAGGYHSLALKSDCSIVNWGAGTEDLGKYPHYGQAISPDGNNFVAIAACGDHSLALKSDGSIAAWGRNHFGQCNVPWPNTDFIAIGAGFLHSLALKSDGSIVAWGVSNGGYLDHGQVTDTPDGNGFVAIAAGGQHSLALKADGSIVGWGGDNRYGQSASPDGNDFVAIAAGYYYSLAIRRGPPIEATMKLTPKVLNRKSRGKWVKVYFVLPEGIRVGDVDSNILGRIDSFGVEADEMDVFVGEDGLVRVEMAFDRAALCEGLAEGGSIEITVKGFLTNSQYFYGTETIKIK